METARQLEMRLRGVGVTGEALHAILDETGIERHNWRCGVAEKCAKEFYLSAMQADENSINPWTLHGACAVVAYADAVGVGSKLVQNVHRPDTFAPVSANARHPAFVGCGTGRKYAKDGPAWDAAIASVTRLGNGRFLPIHDADAWSLHYVGCDCDIVVGPWIGAEWLLGLCMEGLRRSANVRAWFPDMPFDLATMPDAWAFLVNNALEAIRFDAK